MDVAVGTHALLGESVRFKDLGLLVVDEEQVGIRWLWGFVSSENDLFKP